jgi:hypothetical protein
MLQCDHAHQFSSAGCSGVWSGIVLSFVFYYTRIRLERQTATQQIPPDECDGIHSGATDQDAGTQIWMRIRRVSRLLHGLHQLRRFSAWVDTRRVQGCLSHFFECTRLSSPPLLFSPSQRRGGEYWAARGGLAWYELRSIGAQAGRMQSLIGLRMSYVALYVDGRRCECP